MSDDSGRIENVTRLTVDAIGQPGERVFFLQAEKDGETISLILEKIQVETIRFTIERELENLRLTNPELSPFEFTFIEDEMHIHPPVDPLFRVGQVAFGYDELQDQVILVFREALIGEVDENSAQKLALYCSRQQAASLVAWAGELVQRGRPICPYCNQPYSGTHLCPKKNGHGH